MYFQLFFAIDRVKALAKDHPEWKETQPYKSVLENDIKTLMEKMPQETNEQIDKYNQYDKHTSLTNNQFK